MRLSIAILLLALILPTVAGAADATQPHEHRGVLTPYAGTPPAIELSEADLARLEKGKPVMVPVQEGDTGGRGMAVQDVAAAPHVVWGRIVSYDRYPDWVKYVDECETYEKQGHHIKTRFQLSGLGFSYEYYIDHVYRPDRGYMTWTLDYDRQSDLDDSVGYWFVEPHPSKQGWTRVYYSVELALKKQMPEFIIEIATKKGLKEATGWVKREAEKVAAD